LADEWGAMKAPLFRTRIRLSQTDFTARPDRLEQLSEHLLAAQRGFTLIELLIVSAIMVILVVLGVGRYNDHKEEVRVQQAVADILAMSALLSQYTTDNHAPPDSLADVRLQGRIDPWGQPYVYTNLTLPSSTGAARKDKNLNPINSDFDLYSKGKDQDSKPPLSAVVSRDDIVRARDGRFVGVAKDFDP